MIPPADWMPNGPVPPGRSAFAAAGGRGETCERRESPPAPASRSARTVRPKAARRAAADAAIALGREKYLAERPVGEAAAMVAARLLGSAASRAPSWTEYVQRLPRDARWALDRVASPEDLWQAEAACRRRAEDDSQELLRGGGLDAKPVLAAATLLSVDAWRIRAALESAARSGRAAEVFDAVA